MIARTEKEFNGWRFRRTLLPGHSRTKQLNNSTQPERPPGVFFQDRNIASASFQGVMGVSFKMRKRRETGKKPASRGQRSGRRSCVSHTHVSLCMAIPGKPSARLDEYRTLITGQRFLRFSILKETPMAPACKAGAGTEKHANRSACAR
jgi:hypothetical protein